MLKTYFGIGRIDSEFPRNLNCGSCCVHGHQKTCSKEARSRLRRGRARHTIARTPRLHVKRWLAQTLAHMCLGVVLPAAPPGKVLASDATSKAEP